MPPDSNTQMLYMNRLFRFDAKRRAFFALFYYAALKDVHIMQKNLPYILTLKFFQAARLPVQMIRHK